MDKQEIKEEKKEDQNKDLDVLSDEEEKVVELSPEEAPIPEEDETTKLRATIEDLEKEIDKLKNDYARAYADTENMQKRLKAEAENSRKYRIQSFALDILPVIDNFERALSQGAKDEDDAFYRGVEMIYRQLKEALNKEGVTEIDALDKEFDPNYHQAIMTAKVEGKKAGVVVEVLQKGYMLKDRILRASMVKVSE